MYRNAYSHRLPTPAFAPAARDGTDGFQQTVESGCTGGQQPVSYLRVKIEMTMAFHGIHEAGQRRLQAFSTNTVSSFLDHDHRFSDGLIVDAPAPYGMRRVSIVVKFPKQPDAVLTVMSRYSDELVEDPALVLLGRRPVAISYCCQ